MNALNFDPYVALAEIAAGAGLKANGANQAKDSGSLASLALLAPSPAAQSKPTQPPSTPATWSGLLAAIPSDTPVGHRTLEQWQTLLDDSCWLAIYHGPAAHALGWTASDFFGFDPQPGWGGLADRLRGARSLVLTRTVARWTARDCEGWLWRQTLTPRPTIWEATRASQLKSTFAPR